MQFGHKALAIATAQLGVVQSLLQAAEADFDAPAQPVEVDDLFRCQTPGLYDVRQHPHPLSADEHLDQSQFQGWQLRVLSGLGPTQDPPAITTDETVRSFGQEPDVGSHANQKALASLSDQRPQRITDKARVAAKQRVLREFAGGQHVHGMRTFTGI